MEPARGSADDEPRQSSDALRKYGPIAAIAAVVAIVIGVIVAGGGSDDDEPGASGTDEPTVTAPDETDNGGGDDGGDDATDDDGAAPGADGDGSSNDDGSGDDEATDGSGEPGPDTGLPDGVLTFAVAEELGIEADFGERCDPETGRVRVPNFFAPECFAPFEGDNGGATAPGVSEDTIRIVYWVAQESDPVLNYLTDAIVNDDTNADVEDTLRQLLVYYETYYETYGRSVELIVFEGSGFITDGVSARADAVQIAEELDPFMVWSGPTLTNAFAEELAARNIPCLSCGPGQAADFYIDNDPYSWAIGGSSPQTDLMTAEFVEKQLAGRPAIHAGDEAMHDQERVFGRLWIESSAASVDLNEAFEAELSSRGVELAESVSYVLDPGTIQESAATVIARLKAAGVTTVLLTGDPVGPRDFTREATDQDYFPEWVNAGTTLADTNVFARTYDQAQWENAFGLTGGGARVNPEISSTTFIYEWFHGELPAADDTIGVLDPFPGVFYAVLQLVGPDLTPETFRDAIFAADPTTRAITAPSLSWGDEDRWPDDLEPDYFGTDDRAVVWWNPTEVGVDELKREAEGMWMFTDMGTRYLFGEFPEAAPNVFDPSTSISVFQERPADEPVPDYDPLPPGG